MNSSPRKMASVTQKATFARVLMPASSRVLRAFRGISD